MACGIIEMFAASMNTPISRNTLLLLLLLSIAATAFAQTTYEPSYSDPLKDSWRWQALNELGSNNRRIVVNESGNALIQKITNNNSLLFFDGSEQTYLKNLSSDVRSQWRLTFGSKNEILLFSDEGIFQYEDDAWKQLVAHSFRNNYSGELVRAGGNRYWIAGNDGILEFDGQHMYEHPLDQISATGVHDLVMGNDGELWMVVKPTGDVYRCPLIDGRMSPQSDWECVLESGRELVGLSSMILSKENQLWIVNSNEEEGALVYDIASDTWQNHNLLTLGGENFGASIMESHDGKIWVVGRGSLHIYDGNSWSIYKGPEFPIPDGRSSLTQDSDGYVYLLDRGARITRIDYRQKQYRTLAGLHFQSEGLDGNFWYLDVDGKVVTEDRNSEEWFYYSTGETGVESPVAVVALNNGHILCAGSTREVASFSIYNGREWTLYRFPKFARGFSHQGVIKLRNGDVLLGCGQPENQYADIEGGIRRLTYRQGKYVVENHDTLEAPFRSWTLAEDPLTGSVWSGANDLVQFDAGVPSRIVEHPVGSWIDKLAVANNGDLWIALWGNGIFRQRGGEWENLSEDSILSGHQFSHIIFPDGVNPIVSTNSGLFRYDGQSWATIVANGLSLYRAGGTLKQSSDGSLWVNTTHTDWYYRGLQKEAYPEVKKSLFRAVQCLSDTHAPDTIIRNSNLSVFSSSTATVGWLGSDYWFMTPRHLLTYSYSLDGGPWSPYSPETKLTKTDWSHGNPTLRVRTRDADFNIDPVPAFHSFQIILPIWAQTWAQVTMALIVLLIFGLITLVVRQRLQHLLELERIKLHFFTNISHELRTPLTLILGPVEKLLIDQQDGRDNSYLRTIQTNTSRLLYLIDQLLDFRRVEQGRLIVEPRPIDLAGLVKNIMETFDFMVKEKKQTLVFNTPFEACLLELDEDSIYKIIDNLVHNAIKYTPPGGRIEISLNLPEKLVDRDQVETLTFRIQDNGQGVAPDKLANIFEPFYQTSEKPGRMKEGVGIGLALVKELVDLVKGSITVESPVPGFGDGTRFSVDLPVNAPEIIFKADQEPSPVIIDEVSLTEFETEENEKTIRRAHIHLVEDNLDVLKFLQFELSETFDVTVSEDGLEAEAFVLENVPDLVITDVMMPKQDGFDLCRHLKTNPITSHVPIIMLTAFKTPHHEEEGLSLGADDYIAKPVSIRLLNLKVSNLLAQQERLREKIRLEYGLLPSNTSKIRAVDKEFLDKSEEIALRFLDDEFFGVEQFALEMGMSRSNFYKKFRDLTGLSPASYVKVKRLNEAARRIEERAGNITEIAFDVGFSDVSYFSRCFKDHFGCPPSKYISHKAENTVTDMNRSDS